jgi:hypothetical protein
MKRKQVIPAGPNRNTDKSLAKWSSSRRIKAIGAAAVAAAGIVSSRSSSALASGPDTWAGVASINFNNSSDWTGTNTPPASGDSLVFTSTYGTGSLLTDDLFTPGSYTIAGITFAGGAPAYTINPNTTGTNGFTLTTGITNSSTNLQTVNDIITLSGADTFALTTGGGNLALGGNISGSGSMSTAGAAVTPIRAPPPSDPAPRSRREAAMHWARAQWRSAVAPSTWAAVPSALEALPRP